MLGRRLSIALTLVLRLVFTSVSTLRITFSLKRFQLAKNVMIISAENSESMEGEVNGTKALIFKTERFNSATEEDPPRKRKRTSEDFISFCKFILEYENYESIKQEELREKAASPSDSSADSVDSVKQHVGSDTGRAYSHDTPPSRAPPAAVAAWCCRPEPHGNAREEEDEVPLGRRGGLSDEDSHDLITCFCLKPFAGRPMIECSECLTWIHLSCAKIRRNNIPDEFTCQRCREAKHTTRRSQRIRGSGGTPTPQRRRLST